MESCPALSVDSFRGGRISDQSATSLKHETAKIPTKKLLLKNVLGVWGVLQVVYIFSNAIKRLLPVALEPIIKNDISPMHWAMYIGWCLCMAYTEGYKAFHLKFSPSVVHRSFNIGDSPSIIKCILAGPYSMGLFGATKRKMIVSWCITGGVFVLTKLVKNLSYPYRSIVDSGVVLGLSLGLASMLFYTTKSLFGRGIGIELDGDNVSGYQSLKKNH
jgi:hypothetical protein